MIKVELDLLNNAKSDWKRATGINRCKSARKADLACLKSDADWLEINKLDATPVNLSKLSDAVKNKIVKRDAFSELVNKINAIQTNDTSGLVKTSDYDAEIKDVEDKNTTTSDFDTFLDLIFEAKLKEKNCNKQRSWCFWIT